MSSFSGVHNGNYIAATTNENICKTRALLANLPWILGITLDRWMDSLNKELEKGLEIG